MNSEAARQGRPANTSGALKATTAAGREPTVGACWTAADQAECDVLVHRLVLDYTGSTASAARRAGAGPFEALTSSSRAQTSAPIHALG